MADFTHSKKWCCSDLRNGPSSSVLILPSDAQGSGSEIVVERITLFQKNSLMTILDCLIFVENNLHKCCPEFA